MKKFLLCLLLIGATAAASVAITKNWDTITSWFTPAQEETIETPEDETKLPEGETPEDNQDDITENTTPTLSIVIGG